MWWVIDWSKLHIQNFLVIRPSQVISLFLILSQVLRKNKQNFDFFSIFCELFWRGNPLKELFSWRILQFVFSHGLVFFTWLPGRFFEVKFTRNKDIIWNGLKDLNQAKIMFGHHHTKSCRLSKTGQNWSVWLVWVVKLTNWTAFWQIFDEVDFQGRQKLVLYVPVKTTTLPHQKSIDLTTFLPPPQFFVWLFVPFYLALRSGSNVKVNGSRLKVEVEVKGQDQNYLACSGWY